MFIIAASVSAAGTGDRAPSCVWFVITASAATAITSSAAFCFDLIHRGRSYGGRSTLAPQDALASAPSIDPVGAVTGIPRGVLGDGLTGHASIEPPHGYGRATAALDANLAPHGPSGVILHELAELDRGMMLAGAGERVNRRLETGGEG